MSQLIQTSIVTITPELARQMLETNTHNRKISRQRLNILTEALKQGEWALNGEAIKFAEDGALLDGQHRLAAVAQSGIPIQTLMITGLPNATQETMDTGKSRTLADVLTLRGVENAVATASVITGILAVERYGYSKGFIRSASSVITNGSAINRLEQDPFILEIPSRTTRAAHRADLTQKVLGTLYYFFHQINAEDADYFVEKLRDQSNLPEGSPILVLAQSAKQMKEAKGSRNARYLAAVTIKAWNAFRDGREVKLLSFRTGGAKPETFPEPR